jgi:hypothetical protein
MPSVGGSMKPSRSLSDSIDYLNCGTFTSREKREHEKGNTTNYETMPHEVAYFDSQALAAAALNISIDEIRRVKRAGCPAFRSGRVYKKPLLRCLAKNKPKGMKRRARRGPASADYLAKVIPKLFAVAPEMCLSTAFSSLMERYDAGLISSEEYFERCTVITALRRLAAHQKCWKSG